MDFAKLFKTWEYREKEELKLDEGIRLKAYKDTEGIWTAGYGHAYVDPDLEITTEKAEEWLEDDFETAYNRALAVCDSFQGLDSPRKGVLVNMAFNLGTRLSTFHNFLNAIDAGMYDEAAKEMLSSKWAKQVGSRAKRLAYRMATGQYALRT